MRDSGPTRHAAPFTRAHLTYLTLYMLRKQISTAQCNVPSTEDHYSNDDLSFLNSFRHYFQEPPFVAHCYQNMFKVFTVMIMSLCYFLSLLLLLLLLLLLSSLLLLLLLIIVVVFLVAQWHCDYYCYTIKKASAKNKEQIIEMKNNE